jgi:RimJ/RimL family protein N-acetyltransferase
VLDEATLAQCRRSGVALAYDPVQQGWVIATAEDDIDPLSPTGFSHGYGAAGDGRPTLPATASRLQFRRWRESDVPVFMALLDSPRVWMHLPETPPERLTPGYAWDLISLSNGATHHDVLAIEHDGTIVGQIRLAIEPGSTDWREAEISYWLGEAHWGRGIASEAVAAMTERSFRERPGLFAITARVHEDNLASARVLQKAGYREDGPDAKDPAWRIFRLSRARAATAGLMGQHQFRQPWREAGSTGSPARGGIRSGPLHSAGRSAGWTARGDRSAFNSPEPQ